VIFVLRDDFWGRRGLGETGTMNRIAREVAHGWFPDVAKGWSAEEAWLGESLADYTAAYCLGLSSKQQFNARVNEWKRDSSWAGNEVSVLLAEHLGIDSDDLRTRWSLLNGRGPLVVHGVRQRLVERHGEEKGTNMFLTWIRSYVKNFTYKPAHTRGLIAILEQITGESWQAYFDQYLFGTDPSPVK
jgi:aminopeptidase N